MKGKWVPFSFRNVPRMLILVAVIVTVVTVFGIFSPGMWGEQTITFPILCIATGVWWVFVYISGRRPYPDEPPTAAEQETPADRASRRFAEEQPTFQDYLDAEEYIERRRREREEEIPAQPEKYTLDPSHHYDRRV